MHILFLTDNFPPETNAPASRTFEHCREWVRAGHAVTVITGAPNFPQGKLFPGYRNRLWQEERMAGIRVVRVWTFIAANQGFLLRTLDYLSFMFAAFFAALFLPRAQAVVGTSPQFFTAVAAWAVGLVRNIPFVFELRDLWPASIRAVGAIRSPRALRWLERVELFLYRRAALVVALTEAFRRDLMARGIDPARIAVVTNGADLSLFAPLPREPGSRFVSGYLGTHGLAHGLDTVLDAAKLLEARAPGRHMILLVGDGADKVRLADSAEREGIANVRFLAAVPKHRMAQLWSGLDCALVPLKRNPLFATVLPSKIFEAFATGVPVVLGVEGEAKALIEETQAGISVEPENAEALANAIAHLAEHPEIRDRLAANALQAAPRFERSALALRMLGLLEAVAQESALPSAQISREPV